MTTKLTSILLALALALSVHTLGAGAQVDTDDVTSGEVDIHTITIDGGNRYSTNAGVITQHLPDGVDDTFGFLTWVQVLGDDGSLTVWRCPTVRSPSTYAAAVIPVETSCIVELRLGPDEVASIVGDSVAPEPTPPPDNPSVPAITPPAPTPTPPPKFLPIALPAFTG